MLELTREEMETVIRSSAADKEWDIVTADPRMIRYLEKRGYKPKPDHQFQEPFVQFTVPFGRLRFLSTEKRKLTVEQRAQRAIVLARARQSTQAQQTTQKIGTQV